MDKETPPKDWDDLLAFAKRLTVDKNGDGTPDQRGIVFPLKANYGAIWYWLAFFWQQEGKLFNDALNSGAFNSDAGVAATEFWKRMVKEQVLALSAGWADFTAELAAMELSSSSVLGNRRDNMGNKRVGLSALPKGKVNATFTGGGNLVMFSVCPDYEAGWSFLSWLGSTDVNKRWALATGAIPVRKSVLEEPEDLKGKRIGIGPSPVSRAQFAVFLSENGLNPEDVHIATVGFEGERLLIDGDIEALDAVEYANTRTRRKGYEVNFMAYSRFGIPDSPFLIFAARRDWVEENREATRRFLAAAAEGFSGVKQCGLTPIASTKIDAPGFAEAELIIECKKIYSDDYKPDRFLAEHIERSYRSKNYHRIYFGEIEAVWGTAGFKSSPREAL